MEHAETKHLEREPACGAARPATDEAVLLRHYTLSDDDIEQIRVRRGGHNRMGFALQLCAFRYPGRLLVVGEAIPLNVLRFIATQLGMRAEDPGGYGVREETRREHLTEIRRIYGYRMFTGRCARDLKVRLENEAEAARSNEGRGWRGGSWRSADAGRRSCRDYRS